MGVKVRRLKLGFCGELLEPPDYLSCIRIQTKPLSDYLNLAQKVRTFAFVG